MGFKFSKLVTDGDLEIEGVWLPFEEGFDVKLARLGNTKYNEMVRRILKPYTRKIRDEELDDSIAEMAEKKAMARYVLVDWRGLEDDDGEPIEYSKETALQLFEESRDFYLEIRGMARKRGLFQQEADEEAEGNSPPSSSGGSSGRKPLKSQEKKAEPSKV